MKLVLTAFLFSSLLFCVAGKRHHRSHDKHCGLSPAYERYAKILDGNRQKRMIGSDDADDGDWPWVVSVRATISGTPYNLTHFCTAAIISDRWILTAAHCVDDGKSGVVHAAFGAVDHNEQQLIQVEEMFSHPKYDSALTDYDVGLLKLAKRIEFNDRAQPLCLKKSIKVKDYEIVVGAGWGYHFTYFNKSDHEARGSLDPRVGEIPHILQEQRFDVRERNACKFLVEEAKNDVAKLICVGGVNVGAEAGDSGGPLMARRDGHWFSVGVAARSSLGTRVDNRIDVYDDVFYMQTMQFCNFIKRTTQGEAKCQH